MDKKFEIEKNEIIKKYSDIIKVYSVDQDELTRRVIKLLYKD